MFTRNLQRAGAITLFFGSVAFIAVFLYLHGALGYPGILDQGAAGVLPRLAAGGVMLRGAWLLYSALPLTFLVAGIASMPILEDGGGRGLARLGAVAAILAAIAMMLGLMRWPSIHYALASRWSTASAEQREIYEALFESANLYLGKLLGELLGELSLAGWFACVGVALRRSERAVEGTLVLMAAAIVALSAVRQLFSAVLPVAHLGNIVRAVALLAIARIMFARPPAAAHPLRAAAQPRS